MCNDVTKMSLKKTYDEVAEDIYALSNVRIFIGTEKKKNEYVYTLLCLRSADFSKALGLRNLCHSKISVVMLLGRVLLESRENSSQNEKKNMPCAQTNGRTDDGQHIIIIS